MKRIICNLAILLCAMTAMAQRTEANTVRGIIQQVNTYWQQHNAAEANAFWDNAAYHTGNMEVYKLTGDILCLDYSLRWAKHNEWKGAKSDNRSEWKLNYGETDDHVLFGDWQICFQTYCDLYNITREQIYITRAREVMEYEMSTPRHDYWWWADGLYMVMPVMTKLYKITGNELYLNKLYEYISYSDSIMYDNETGLYYRDAKYVYPKHKSVNGKKDFWARGDGWVLAGLAKVLQDLPKDNVHRKFFEEKYQRLAKAVAKIQQPDGYWTRSMMDADHAPGPETSGTAFFTYGILWGINNGLLATEEFLPVVQRSWHYLTTTALQSDGRIGYVQPIGEKAIPGQVVDSNSTANFGVGAFLLAACEYVRFLEGQQHACHGRVYPEHRRDLSWENDRVGFRAYGPECSDYKEQLWGYDLFMKRTSRPMLDQWYEDQFSPTYWERINNLKKDGHAAEAHQLEDSITYHIDHGDGADFYAVGPTLGAGTNALMVDGTLLYPHYYNKVEILHNGPDYFEAHLTFPPTAVGNDNDVVEHRLLRLDRGSQLTKATVWYEHLTHDATIAVGIVLHGDNPYTFSDLSGASDSGSNKQAYWMTYDDPTQSADGHDGIIRIGCVFPEKPSTIQVFPNEQQSSDKTPRHLLATTPLKAGTSYTYYFGFGWTKYGFADAEVWKAYLQHFADSVSAASPTLSPVGNGYSSTSVNTTIFRNSSIVTSGDWQFISYYDNDGYLCLGKRRATGTPSAWQLSRTQYQGNVKDAHNVISMMVDGKGYLHVAFDHHGNKLRYCRSKKPYSLELGELQPMTGKDEDDVTYPEFYRLSGGNLLFAYRSGASGRGNLVMNRYDVKKRRWSRLQDILIDGENQRNAYWQLHVDTKGVIHVSWVWRETWMVETNHDLCYARSSDGGITWTHSDGTPYALPITAANAEYAWNIPQNSELINQTSMTTDAEGHPYIATYWRDADSNIPQYRLVWHDGSQWQQRQVSRRTTPFTLKGGGTKMIPIARPRMVVNNDTAYYIFRDEERASRASMYVFDIKADDSDIRCYDLTDFPVHAWEPSIDTELWNRDHRLNIFVQDTMQGDGEKTVSTDAKMIYVLEQVAQ